MDKIICGNCNSEFETIDLERVHICSTTGFKPIDPQHYGDDFSKIQLEALKRGLTYGITNGNQDIIKDNTQAIKELESA